MMDWTDPAFRWLLRQITRRTRLYTEMVPAQALWHGRSARFLDRSEIENPVALQLGGSDAAQLAHGACQGARWGYDEINLNVGCPSDRVQSGRFGACLMREPERVRTLVTAMAEASDRPVTVKCRIGDDELDDFDSLCRFTEAVTAGGSQALIVHARKAWLNGLSPKQNRDIPPLRYDRVEALKAAFPGLPIVLNGGIETLEQAMPWIERLDGVMIGRAAYHDPWLFAQADAEVYGDSPAKRPSRESVALAYRDYVAARRRPGVPVSRYTRHLTGLFQGQPGARVWRRALSEGAADKSAGAAVIDQALAARRAAIERHAASTAESA
jgi:tRNA-dihydrouridine synthase A